MKKQMRLLLSLTLFAVLLGGSYWMYNTFRQTYKPPMNLAIEEESGVLEAEPKETEMTERETFAVEPETDQETMETETMPEAEEAAAGQETEAEPTEVPVFDFTVQDWDGNTVCLSDLTGKPVVLNFWASWCPPCRSEMGEFEEAYQAVGEELQFMMINMTDGVEETLDSAKAFVAEKGYTFPVYFDTEMDAAMTFGVYSMPVTYFLDAAGAVVAYARGAIDGETLQIGIGMITEQS